VAVLSRTPPLAVRVGLGDVPGAREFDGTGRWVEADLPVQFLPSRPANPADAVLTGPTANPADAVLTGPTANPADAVLTVVSVYVHKGEAGTAKQAEKFRFLDAVSARLAELTAHGRPVVVCGDLNIAHREVDLKNWKGNRDRAGFLPAERAWLDRLIGEGGGWVDVQRSLAGEGPGPYTWWSWRGKAFDNDAGWRIDYQLASPALAAHAVKAEVDRAPTYAERWSDHAPVVVEYDLRVACRAPFEGMYGLSM
jgi:exodeoxyribonuclease-3